MVREGASEQRKGKGGEVWLPIWKDWTNSIREGVRKL